MLLKQLNELRSKHAEKIEKMQSLMATAESEQRSLNEDEGKEFDELRSESENLKTEIGRVEALIEEERAKVPSGKDQGTDGPSNEEMRNYILTGESRSLKTTVDQDGGYTVIPELDRQVMRRLIDESELRKICNVVTTASNQYEKLVSIGGATVGRGTENSARSETDSPQMEKVTIAVNPVYAYPKTTQEILDFSDIDIMGWLTDEISDTFTETEDSDLVTGNGTGKALGFMASPTAATADASRAFGTLEKMVVAGTDAITADELIDVLYKLKAKYRKNASWVMNSSTAAAIQKLKDGNGNYLWRESFTAGEPSALLGRPVYFLESMPDLGTGNAPVAVGDFKRGYFIVDHTTGVRTRPDNITEPGFYKVHTDKYLGGKVVDSNAIKVLENA